MSSENILRFLSEPATLASLAAVAAASMMYVTSRPTPLKCPVDPNQQSVEVPVSYSLFNSSYLFPRQANLYFHHELLSIAKTRDLGFDSCPDIVKFLQYDFI